MPWPGCNDAPPGHIHTSQCPIPAHVGSGEPPCPPNLVPMSGNCGACSKECASTSGDHQEASRVCQTLRCPVCLPLQPLVKPPLYTADRKQRTKSPAAVKPAGVPFHAPEPCVQPLSFLPRGECCIPHGACTLLGGPANGPQRLQPVAYIATTALPTP